MELLITEKSGWSKSIKTDRAVIRIGSTSSNDVQLQSPKIASVHIQILHPTTTDSSCKVVNLAHEITVKVAREILRLPLDATIDVRDGDEILLDDYSIKFCLPLSANVMQPARAIQATLSFADAVLRATFTTTGVLTIKNAGEHSACQFQVDLAGLPEDCFQIDPIPLMYSGAQEEVRIRIFHRILYPPAGLQTIVLKVSAPESYPGEELIIRQDIYVTPVFKQALELFDDVHAATQTKKQAEAVGPAAEPVSLVPSSPPVLTESSEARLHTDKQPDLLAQESAMPIAPRSAPDLSSFKVASALERDEEDSTRAPLNSPTITSSEIPDISSPAQQLAGLPQKQATPVASQPVPDISKLKVVRDRSDGDNFWDEK